MQRRSVRVILASEYPKIRHLLREVVEEAPGAVIVGQAENATRALTLARNLRPDVAIIDCNLPHAVGLDNVSLSRIGGLDTAQTISHDIPNTSVILLGNVDVKLLSEQGLGTDVTASFSRQRGESKIPFALQDLYREAVSSGDLVFANVEVNQQASLKRKMADISDKAVLFGGLSTLGGLCLMLTVFLAGAGVFLALAGAAAMLLGLAGKLVIAWRKLPQRM